MSPDMVHRMCQEIRHQRALLTAEEKWARTQPYSDTRVEIFQRINLWRDALDYIERKIATGSRHTLGATG